MDSGQNRGYGPARISFAILLEGWYRAATHACLGRRDSYEAGVRQQRRGAVNPIQLTSNEMGLGTGNLKEV